MHAYDKRFIGSRWRDDSGGVDYVVIAGVNSRKGGSGPSFIKQGSREQKFSDIDGGAKIGGGLRYMTCRYSLNFRVGSL